VKDVLSEITRLRLQRNWSEYELAQHSGLAQSTISNWYRKKQIPTIPTLEKVCCGFGITLSQFFASEDDVVSLTVEQKQLLDCWAALTDTQQALFMDLFRSIPG
jgi:transcriptional regulator with XRE-family HTH domain